ncbi:MFS transporter [Arcanobacterium phocae]|uniref:MFS transporter n=1 Tax=Arcanobacterium phocae TaxID=131112 RepID=UPI001C0E9831
MKIAKSSVARPFRGYLIAKCLIASVMAWPLMTLILQAKGLSYLEIGLLNSFGAVVSLLFEVPMGRLADRFGQKYALAFGSLLIALGVSVLALFDALPAVYLSELVIGAGLALSSGADSAWLFQEHKRLGMEDDYLKSRSAVGSVTLLFSMTSSVVGPILFSWRTNLPLWMSVACYIAAAGVFLRLRLHDQLSSESSKADQSSHGAHKLGTVIRRVAGVIRNHSLFVSLALASTIVMIAVSNYSTYLGPFLEERGLEVRNLGIVLVIGKIVQWLAVRNTYRLKRSTDHERLRVLTVMGLVILFLVAVSVTMPSTPWIGAGSFVLLSGLASVFFILIDEQVNLVISDKYRTTMLSIVAMFDEAATIAVDPVIGAVLDALGFSRTYLLLSAVLSVSFCLVVALATYSTRNLSDRNDPAGH